eukprot:CAMPEP_0197843044 /NCGR_PEP_ID=MMETSP1437-20131217/47094_1 /TAXON_ID=49252 ORGANISM="Eucampia antarctica, Strain CCMP1452" /NCGR_SAMPLE_ID=MMETSP1437 /ASSEMBLY_ACC=CAM_ASM_001096 /LENGTH=255 /DNA_ID=CAMNT_0043453025 /DNA_START=997 /DNA_END=1761 /DNA_ORIENTATION=+
MVEWIYTCAMMMISGVMWAIMIASFMNIMKRQSANSFHMSKLYEANEMIKDFDEYDMDSNNNNANGICNKFDLKNDVTERITKFILDQRERNYNIGTCASNLSNEYAAFGSLSKELQRMSSYLIFKPYLNGVPYLSSKYLSIDEQSFLSLKCQLRCFAAGEIVVLNDSPLKRNSSERGIFVIIEGLGFVRSTQRRRRYFPITYLKSGEAYGFEQVLVEDNIQMGIDEIMFPLFSKLLFIPRESIMDILERKHQAW